LQDKGLNKTEDPPELPFAPRFASTGFIVNIYGGMIYGKVFLHGGDNLHGRNKATNKGFVSLP
jgi:hypothetical protein